MLINNFIPLKNSLGQVYYFESNLDLIMMIQTV